MTTTIPALIFALIVALLLGALYHFARGGSGWKLLLFFVLSALGFAAGQAISVWRGWVLMQFGMLDVGMGTLGSVLFLLTGDWLSRIDVNGNNTSGQES